MSDSLWMIPAHRVDATTARRAERQVVVEDVDPHLLLEPQVDLQRRVDVADGTRHGVGRQVSLIERAVRDDARALEQRADALVLRQDRPARRGRVDAVSGDHPQ